MLETALVTVMLTTTGLAGDVAAESLEELRRATTAGDVESRRKAARSIGKMGTRAAAATAELSHLLDDKDCSVRSEASLAYWRVCGDAARSLERLSVILRTEEESCVLDGLRALGDMGEVAASSIPYVQPLLNDGSDRVRATTAWALGNVGTAAAPAVAQLRKMRDEDGSVLAQEQARWALFRIDPESAVAELVAILETGGEVSQQMAATTLGDLGVAARPAVAALVRVVRMRPDSGKNPGEARSRVRLAAITALGRVGYNREDICGALLGVVEDVREPKALRDAAKAALEAVKTRR